MKKTIDFKNSELSVPTYSLFLLSLFHFHSLSITQGRGIVTWTNGIRFKGLFRGKTRIILRTSFTIHIFHPSAINQTFLFTTGWKNAQGELMMASDNTRLVAELQEGVWRIQVPNTILKRIEYPIWQIPANIHERALLREKEKRKSW